jgi:hypothetical protein
MFSLIKQAVPLAVLLIALVLGYVSTNGSKSQTIRIVDILIIGPLMFYLGYIGYYGIISDNKWLYVILMFFGGTTITYNLYNYLHIARMFQ